MLMPFSSTYAVHNLGIDVEKLPIVYFVSGIFSIFIGPLVGRASDRFGKFNIFTFGTFFTVLMVYIYTNLGVTPLIEVIFISTLMFIGISSRMIPSQALMSAVPEPANRGSFMSVNSSMQQFSGGIASIIAGMLITEKSDHTIVGFNHIGYIMIVISFISLIMMYLINRMVLENRSFMGK